MAGATAVECGNLNTKIEELTLSLIESEFQLDSVLISLVKEDQLIADFSSPLDKQFLIC
ncbi:MAG: hypothetical protein ACI837_003387 [Crocinitomicaceae bacterium]|jgi:hypothetical protein